MNVILNMLHEDISNTVTKRNVKRLLVQNVSNKITKEKSVTEHLKWTRLKTCYFFENKELLVFCCFKCLLSTLETIILRFVRIFVFSLKKSFFSHQRRHRSLPINSLKKNIRGIGRKTITLTFYKNFKQIRIFVHCPWIF